MILAFDSMSFHFSHLIGNILRRRFPSFFFGQFLARTPVSDGFGPDGMTKVWLPIVSRCPPIDSSAAHLATRSWVEHWGEFLAAKNFCDFFFATRTISRKYTTTLWVWFHREPNKFTYHHLHHHRKPNRFQNGGGDSWGRGPLSLLHLEHPLLHCDGSCPPSLDSCSCSGLSSSSLWANPPHAQCVNWARHLYVFRRPQFDFRNSYRCFP